MLFKIALHFQKILAISLYLTMGANALVTYRTKQYKENFSQLYLAPRVIVINKEISKKKNLTVSNTIIANLELRTATCGSIAINSRTSYRLWQSDPGSKIRRKDPDLQANIGVDTGS
jgi:hypothetical protein